VNLVAILIGLVVLVIFLGILFKILGKLFAKLKLDEDWQNIIFGIISLAVLIMALGYFGYGGGLFPLR
jgi:hypothetical protein